MLVSLAAGGRLFAAALLALFLAVPAGAQNSAADVCDDVAKKAGRVLWNEVREAGDEMFCSKAWLPGLRDPFKACAGWTFANAFSNKIKNRWNRTFNDAGADWATWGPRGVAETWEEGTIRGGFKRTFFGPGLAYHTTEAEVVKEGGRAEATVTVCRLDHAGEVASADRRTFASGQGGEGTTRRVRLENDETHIVAVVVDTPPSVNRFEYRVRLTQEPTRNDLGPVKGIADLHVHQLMGLAFAGRMYWGQHDGPPAQALAREEVTGAVNGTLDGALRAIAGETAVDANQLIALINGKTTDEGFYTVGTAGHPRYEDWPHHADRSHQQVHMDWVDEARKRGQENGSNLGLMVVSIVHNNILCQVLKAVDTRGNVPDGVGWASAPWGCSDHENVQRQLEAVHELERKYPWYRVAMSPWHARQIIADGDLAVVLSLETDKPLSSEGGNYGDWEDQLNAYRSMGVTTMQIVHEGNSRFAGAALHRDMMGALQLVHWPLKSLANLVRSGSTFNKNGKGHNSLGLTKQGEQLIDVMVKARMPIDLAHMSINARRQTMARIPKGYGLYDSHTKFERLLKPGRGQRDYGTHVLDREQEFLITEEILPLYVQHQVVVGLRPAPVDVYDAPRTRRARRVIPNDCPGSANSFAQLVSYAYSRGLPMAYGSDFNTGVAQLGPRFGPERCWAARKIVDEAFRTSRPVGDQEQMPARARAVGEIAGTNYYTDGLATIGWLPELTYDLVALGTPGARQLRDGAEAYIAMWERAYEAAGADQPVAATEPMSLGLGQACTGNDQCRSGRCTNALPGTRGICVCNEDDDCRSGTFCDMGVDLKTNACVALKADGEACPLVNGGRTCQSGQCRNGRCFTPNSVALGGACWTDDACAQGACNNAAPGTRGTCVCRNDGDCGSGTYCDAGLDLKRNACVALKADGEACPLVNGGRTCQSGQCKNGRCFTPNSVAMGGECWADDACAQGKCNNAAPGTKGTCVCKTDGDCGSGYWCDGGLDLKKNACKRKLNKGEVCGTVGELGVGHRCKSGKCKAKGVFSSDLVCK